MKKRDDPARGVRDSMPLGAGATTPGRRSRACITILCWVILLAATALSAEEERSLDELLDLGLPELLDLEVVTPSKVPQRLLEVPGTVIVITEEQIAERGYLSLEEALSDLPGLQFRNIQGFNSYVFLRGAPSQNNLILLLVDGIQINELHSGGFYGGLQHDLSNIERIEVVYGPASALYGTNAVSGVINLVTRDPRRSHPSTGQLTMGSFDTRILHLDTTIKHPDRDLGITLSGQWVQTEKADLGGAEGDFNWTTGMENFEEDFSLSATARYGELVAGVLVQDKSASRTTNYRTVGDVYRDRGTEWHIRFINSYLRHVYRRSDSWSLTSQAYYRNTTVEDDTVAFIDSEAQVGYYRPNWLVGGEAIVEASITENLQVVGGVVLEREGLSEGFSRTASSSPDLPPPPPPRPEMQHNTLLSGFAQARYRPHEFWQLSAGGRFDDSSAYDQVFTPSASVAYRRTRWNLRLLYGEAFRGPRPWDYTDGAGNPDLHPEEMRSVELAGTVELSRRLRLSVAAYRNQLEGGLTREEIADSWRWVNRGRLDSEGLEVALEYRRGELSGFFNYSYSQSTDEEGESIPEIAEHTANLGLRYRWAKRIVLSLRANYLGSRLNPTVVTSTGSRQIDDALPIHAALMVQDLGRWQVQLIAKNLLDTTYYHTSNRPPDRYRQPQRSVLLRLTGRF